MKRIVCIGNRWRPDDDVGPRVHDWLACQPLPADVQLVEGGTRGLNLLGALEGVERVVLVDRSVGLGAGAPWVLWRGADAAALATGVPGHGAGLAELLAWAPQVCDHLAPELWVLGIEAQVEDAAGLSRLGALALAVACHGAAASCATSAPAAEA